MLGVRLFLSLNWLVGGNRGGDGVGDCGSRSKLPMTEISSVNTGAFSRGFIASRNASRGSDVDDRISLMAFNEGIFSSNWQFVRNI